MNTQQSPIHVECFTRATSPASLTDGSIDTVREYVASGLVDELSVRRWPREVNLSRPAGQRVAIERFETFRAWADSNGVELEPAFEVRERTTLVDDTPAEILVLPAVCLAVHVDGTLASVVPHRTETTTYTVDDALAALRSDEPAWTLSGHDPNLAPRSDREPPAAGEEGQALLQ